MRHVLLSMHKMIFLYVQKDLSVAKSKVQLIIIFAQFLPNINQVTWFQLEESSSLIVVISILSWDTTVRYQISMYQLISLVAWFCGQFFEIYHHYCLFNKIFAIVDSSQFLKFRKWDDISIKFHSGAL